MKTTKLGLLALMLTTSVSLAACGQSSSSSSSSEKKEASQEDTQQKQYKKEYEKYVHTWLPQIKESISKENMIKTVDLTKATDPKALAKFKKEAMQEKMDATKLIILRVKDIDKELTYPKLKAENKKIQTLYEDYAKGLKNNNPSLNVLLDFDTIKSEIKDLAKDVDVDPKSFFI
ncbi:hypothetical protein A374_06696 [Fictibacillus macauensis ZFHKF-1]|uniref:Lipoprotein n=1 Tax=Fictibacillus macauensis ZFHKF-1 TaxID=1196324 RepID=I8AK92_9BACL|nr:hypothetical protein [Fictibacillus macauensis]EIT86267.1 hypothetical protein A374_06696 [Fictibacillus macauensis ZFHKF-1]